MKQQDNLLKPSIQIRGGLKLSLLLSLPKG